MQMMEERLSATLCSYNDPYDTWSILYEASNCVLRLSNNESDNEEAEDFVFSPISNVLICASCAVVSLKG